MGVVACPYTPVARGAHTTINSTMICKKVRLCKYGGATGLQWTDCPTAQGASHRRFLLRLSLLRGAQGRNQTIDTGQ